LAVIHYQFEAIHPFFDGNGRTGRILNLLYLIEKGILDLPILYLSRFLINNKHLYYKLLLEVTEKGAWEAWVLFMLDAVIDTAKISKKRVVKIKKLIDETADLIKEKLPKIYSRELIEILFTHPYCKIAFLEQGGIAKRQTASLYLQKLEEVGVLSGYQKGREKYYINFKFLELLGE
jgi:Fic family protein